MPEPEDPCGAMPKVFLAARPVSQTAVNALFAPRSKPAAQKAAEEAALEAVAEGKRRRPRARPPAEPEEKTRKGRGAAGLGSLGDIYDGSSRSKAENTANKKKTRPPTAPKKGTKRGPKK